MSQSNVTVADAPRVSRREADKITVGPWPKIQDVETWKSDVVKSVILAANDGYRAAWQEWILPAIADNPDLDALNDSGGSRFQSIDTKLSIALTSVINQSGEAGRDVHMLLRQRTQAAGRRASFAMGREILAMILNHFKNPGLRNTLFTMEHIDQFYHKWMEMSSNMLPLRGPTTRKGNRIQLTRAVYEKKSSCARKAFVCSENKISIFQQWKL